MLPTRSSAHFGPAGGCDEYNSVKHKSSADAPMWVKNYGLDCYEYQCGGGVHGSEALFRSVGEAAKAAGIEMSLHAPYYISLSGVEIEKRLGSLRYISESLQACEWIGGNQIVVHTGSAAKISRSEAMELAKDTLYKALEEIPDNGIIIGLETMGKQNQLGTPEEVVELCEMDPRLRPVVDFGHINAYHCGGYFTSADDYRRVFDLIGSRLGDDTAKNLHCHFSKIEYTAKGEKKHLTFDDTVFGPPFEPLAELVAKEGLTPRIICESDGTQSRDALIFKNKYLEYKGN